MLPLYMDTISTVEIANMMNIEHKHVLVKVRKNICILEKQNIDINDFFIESTYVNQQNKKQPCYICTLNGVKMVLDSTRNYKNKKELLEWYESRCINGNVQNIILCDREEKCFVKEIREVFESMGIESVTQYPVLIYRIDLYLPKFNIAIEYDENDHKNYTYKKQEFRQNKIEKAIGCKFIRLSDSNTNLYNIGVVMREICNANHS